MAIILPLVLYFILHYTFKDANIPRVFDFARGLYWKGDENFGEAKRVVDKCKLKEIHALQIIRKTVRTKYNHNTGVPGIRRASFEINLILMDASRINVVDQPGIKPTQEDGKKISQALKIPLWDASSFDQNARSSSWKECIEFLKNIFSRK